MSDQVLYRKYRSGSFAEVIGQDHIVRTLTSAIAAGRLAHAYLFTGPRGVGKTSVARLLARAANCTGGPDKPCGACVMCQAAISSSTDLVEIDAASNRSIDSIRDLREKVNLAPSMGTYKVYIIDEVHMLTTEAFNALLKTLEEPPAHAMFILATTEAHKVPETIVSRTQTFAFRPIDHDSLTRHLRHIAGQEAIKITDDALALIADTARGGFRDAISLLDQLRAATGAEITADAVRHLLGYTGHTELLAIAGAIAKRDPATALATIAQLEASGAQAGHVASQLTELIRQVMFAAAGATASATPDIAALAKTLGAHRAAVILEQLIETQRSHWPSLALQAAVVKLSTQPATPPARPAAASQPSAANAPAPAATPAPAAAPASNPAAPSAPEPPASPAGELSRELWPKVLVLLKSKNNSLGALLQMYPASFGADEITILPRFNFHRDLFLKPANRTLIEAASTKVYGRPVKIGARTEDDGQAAARRKTPKPDPNAELVSSALEILGGEVVD